eukprot:m51a1_g8287 hypothetical protein (309) ;mRNA; r:122821-124307
MSAAVSSLPSSSGAGEPEWCPEPRFSCGDTSTLAARVALIAAYAAQLALAAAAARTLRRRALLLSAVAAVMAYDLARIALFSIPVVRYTTRSWLRKGYVGAQIFVDLFPECIYFIAVALAFSAYAALVRSLHRLRQRRRLSTSADGRPLDCPLATSDPRAALLQTELKARVLMGAAGAVLLALTIGASVVCQAMLYAHSPWDEFLERVDPVVDTVFICVATCAVELLLIAAALLYPCRVRAALVLASVPAVKGLYSGFEWYIWRVRARWLWGVLWVTYFVVTDLVPVSLLLGALIARHRRRVGSQRWF